MAVIEQALLNPAGNFCTTALAEAEQTIVVGDGHDAGIDGNGNAMLVAAVEKVCIGVGI